MISTTTSVASYTATASQTVFAYGFRIQNQSDLLVFSRGIDGLRSNITASVVSVSGVDSEGGGNVTLPAQTVGTIIFLVRSSTFTQLWDASNLNFFDPATVERVVDKLTILVQEVKSGVDASIRFEPGEQVAAIPKVTRAGKVLAFDEDGDPSFITPDGVLYTPGDSLAADSIASLKAISVSGLTNNQAVSVLGYYAAGDGGGGTFYYDSGSATADNGGTVIAPTTGTGRWLRVYSDNVTLRQFGAKGDSVTDNTLFIQAAFDFAKLKNLIVRESGGIFLFSNSLYFCASFYGAGSNETVFKPLAGVSINKGAIIISGIGYTADASSFTLHSSYSGTVFESFGDIKAAMVANNRSAAWGSVFCGFGLKADARASVKQNGLVLQQIALIDVSNIYVKNMNGVGLLEDGLQDCKLSNIHVESCGRDSVGDEIAQFVVHQFWSVAGLDSTARVVHTYLQIEKSTYRNLDTYAVGTSGSGRGGSTLNVFNGLHIEPNGAGDKSYLRGFIDNWTNGSLANETVYITGGRQIFTGVDFGGQVLRFQIPDVETGYFSGCVGIANLFLISGVLHVSACGITLLTMRSESGNGSLVANSCSMTLAHDNVKWPAVLSNCTLSFTGILSNWDTLKVVGGSLAITGTPFLANSTFCSVTFTGVVDMTLSSPICNACVFTGNVVLGGGAAYRPRFTGCTFLGRVDNGSAGQANTGVVINACVLYGDTLVANGNGSVFNSTIETGKTLNAVIFAGNNVV